VSANSFAEFEDDGVFEESGDVGLGLDVDDLSHFAVAERAEIPNWTPASLCLRCALSSPHESLSTGLDPLVSSVSCPPSRLSLLKAI